MQFLQLLRWYSPNEKEATQESNNTSFNAIRPPDSPAI
jgi:hypothetical protein